MLQRSAFLGGFMPEAADQSVKVVMVGAIILRLLHQAQT
jgi:hypothetical protein